MRLVISALPSGQPQPYSELPESTGDAGGAGGEGAEAGGIAAAGGGAAIGRLGGSDKLYFQGSLDEVAVYNHRLSGDHILAHYRAALDGVKSPSDMIVVGHRGNNRFAPENTLVSFDQGIDAGADIIEMDLHRSSDGVVVLIHDNTVDRTTNGIGEVA
jgi:Glycerophosphoryl diester phosphodiesterase family